MAPQTPSSTKSGLLTPSRTPQTKHRFPFKNLHPSPSPISANKGEHLHTEHPVEVIGRIRDYPDQKEKPISGLQISSDRCSIRVRTEFGYRNFSLDGVSVSDEEGLDLFYKKFIQSRINGVKLGSKCTIMMYGPTGAGKSHTMFGCPKQPGIVYRALRDILGEGDEEIGFGSFVQVTVLEIYNEEIYDLLSNSNGGGLGLGWPKGNASKVRLEVMGKKAKNASFISGNEAGKISREVAKVEKRRIVKSTLCNDRSSRSHCMIILDVPNVGGRLMLVDMAGSENIDQAGQVGFEAKMQTGKINQGNIALKRVVESIANGDSHVPFRDSKLTMLLQDSFEDNKSKILMVLCASPDPKEMHKTICTLEYGAKAKCIVRGGHTPNKEKEESSVISRITAMDQFIIKLQLENKRREKEHNEAHKELLRKEDEVAALRAKLALLEGNGPTVSEEEINLKVKERTEKMKLDLERKLQECQKMASDFVELGKRRMEEKILQQQEELELLRRRLEEIESELSRCKDKNGNENGLRCSEGNGLAKRLLEIYSEGDIGMEKSMDLDMGDPQPIIVLDVKEVEKGVVKSECSDSKTVNPGLWTSTEEEEKVHLSTVFEEEEGEDKESSEDEEVEKEIVEETHVRTGDSSPGFKSDTGSFLSPQNLVQTPRPCTRNIEKFDLDKLENSKDPVSARKTRIQNIFMLCGNHREIAQHVGIPLTPCKKGSETPGVQALPLAAVTVDTTAKAVSKEMSSVNAPNFGMQDRVLSDMTTGNIVEAPNSSLKFANVRQSIEEFKKLEAQLNRNQDSKENYRPDNDETRDDQVEVYVKWEASKENQGKFITKLKVLNDSSLSDLRKLIEIHLGEDNSQQGFTFLMLGDPTGAPVPKENEATVRANQLPSCNNQANVHLACLRVQKVIQRCNHLTSPSAPYVTSGLVR